MFPKTTYPDNLHALLLTASKGNALPLWQAVPLAAALAALPAGTLRNDFPLPQPPEEQLRGTAVSDEAGAVYRLCALLFRLLSGRDLPERDSLANRRSDGGRSLPCRRGGPVPSTGPGTPVGTCPPIPEQRRSYIRYGGGGGTRERPNPAWPVPSWNCGGVRWQNHPLGISCHFRTAAGFVPSAVPVGYQGGKPPPLPGGTGMGNCARHGSPLPLRHSRRWDQPFAGLSLASSAGADPGSGRRRAGFYAGS